jgi:hypothetical protein
MLAVKQEMFEGKPRTITMDPTDKYKSIPVDRLVDACGVLIAWAWNAVVAENPRKTFTGCYAFGCTEMTGGVVNVDGVYKFPHDPALHPIASISYGNATVYIYEYSIVAVVVDGVSFVTRMD